MPHEMFAGARLKIERAHQLIRELAAAIDEFSGRRPYRLVCEPDDLPGSYAWRIHARETMPDSFPLLIGDAIHNIRASLDIAVCEVVQRFGGNVHRSVSFPFAESASSLEQTILSRGLGQTNAGIMQYFRDLKPYEGGNADLCAIHKLDIADKHVQLIPIAHTAELSMSFRTAGGGSVNFVGVRVGGPSQPGDLPRTIISGAARVGVRPGEERELGPFDVCFAKGQPLQLQSVVPAVGRLQNLASGIVAELISRSEPAS